MRGSTPTYRFDHRALRHCCSLEVEWPGWVRVALAILHRRVGGVEIEGCSRGTQMLPIFVIQTTARLSKRVY